METIILNNKLECPVIGIGTFMLSPEDAENSVREALKMEPTVRYLYDADVVITDYSSIMFDAYLLGKPVVLFEKQTGYVKNRGMYLDYPEEYCSRYATNERDLIQLARFAHDLRKTERDCLNYVADMCDGHSCERICELIREVNER